MIKQLSKVLLAGFLTLGLAACGGKGNSETSKSSNVKMPDPAANVDPMDIHPGAILNDEMSSDYWFSQSSEDEYMYLEYTNEDNCPSGKDVIFVQGDKTYSSPSQITEDKHLVNTTEGTAEFDLIFYDVFKAYDNKTKTWYVRGDIDALKTMLTGTTYISEDKDESFTFNKDGVLKRKFSDVEEEAEWFIEASTVVSWIYTSDGYLQECDILYNEDGSIAYLQIGRMTPKKFYLDEKSSK
ncbi:MAG: hypothetical protein HUJ53_03800 [Holdemanella sp.]|nr:hypothetical protein [Holdemanella sp.]